MSICFWLAAAAERLRAVVVTKQTGACAGGMYAESGPPLLGSHFTVQLEKIEIKRKEKQILQKWSKTNLTINPPTVYLKMFSSQVLSSNIINQNYHPGAYKYYNYNMTMTVLSATLHSLWWAELKAINVTI